MSRRSHHHLSVAMHGRFWLLTALLALCFVGGGASRNDVTSLLYLQPAAVLLAMTILLLPGPVRMSSIRVPMIFLSALALLMMLQLVPLPAQIWMQLPGRAPLAEAAQAINLPTVNRPLSLTPDRTINSLIGLVTPFAVLLGYAAIAPEDRRHLPMLLLAGTLASAVLAIAQLGAGPDSPLYLYAITNDNAGVGLLANRNHQACLLSLGYPLLAWWGLRERGNKARTDLRRWLAAILALFLLPMILVTGSRAGLAAAVLSLLATGFVFRGDIRKVMGTSIRGRLAMMLILGAAALLVVMAIVLARAEAWDRVGFSEATQDLRFTNLSLYFAMVAEHFPVGSGFGSFEPLYKAYEPLDSLGFAYLNHAHNDLLEFVIDGGLGAMLLLAAFIAWFLAASSRVLRSSRMETNGTRLGPVGAIVIAILLAFSLFDYPLRTPLLAALMALSCAWLADAAQTAIARTRGRAVPPLSP